MSLKLQTDMAKVCLFVFVCLVHHATGYYRLTEEQFAMMPPLLHVDRFSHCVNRPGGLYCTTYADVVADQPSALLDMMHNYSMSAPRHYNYTKLLYGLCLTDMDCIHHLKGNSTPEIMKAAEGCLNDTLRRKYDLGVRVEKVNCYRYKDDRYKVDYVDNLVFYVLAGIVALNILSTVYDFACNEDEVEGFLLCFSLRANWRRLVAPPSKNPRRSRLIGINGIRVITTVLVMLGHAPVPSFMAIENPQWLEESFENVGLQILFQGHIITQTFFVISGFLLTYNIQMTNGTRQLSWSSLTKGIIARWLRLSPVNMVMLALTATWFKFSRFGPFWQEDIGNEVADCRKYWPSVVFYYNNYIPDCSCSLQNWSMASDLHLHFLGMLLLVISPTAKIRNRLLLAAFVIGLILPAMEIYFRDLDGNFLVVAHAVRTYMMSVPTFIYLYTRTHTNIPCFIMGMFLGYYLYDLEQKPISGKLKKVLGYAYWSLFPLMLWLAAFQFLLFLGDGPRAPMWMRILFSVLQKPTFGLIICLIIVGLAVRIEETRLYSWILESPIWVPLSKLTYCMFSAHIMVVRYIGGTKSALSHLTMTSTMQEYAGVVVLATVFAFILYMLIEAPFGQLCRLLLLPRSKSNASLKPKENETYKNGKVTQTENGNYIHSNGKPLKSE